MKGINRRNILAGALLGSAVAGVGAPILLNRGDSGSRSRQVVISGWGGATQRAMRKAYFDPFTRETGIEVVEVSYGSHGLARVKSQLAEGRTRVDLLDGPPFWPVVGREHGLLDRISLQGVDRSHFMPGALGDYALGYSTVSWGISCLRQRGAAPHSWSDFWDTEAFPGPRAFFGPFVARHPEYALMADGVAPEDVYPLDDAKMKRAFAKLADINPAIDVWYQTAAQCEQLLLNRQIQMAEFFNGRTFFLQDQGVPLEFVWNQAVMNMPVFVLARGAPNRADALEFLSYLTRPEPQARFAELIWYGPTNFRGLDLIDDEKTLERLPTYSVNRSRQLLFDADWWGENLDRYSPEWAQSISA